MAQAGALLGLAADGPGSLTSAGPAGYEVWGTW